MRKQILYLLAFTFIMVIGCQKEKSFEQPNTPSEGSLQSDVSGDCLPKTVNGTYLAGTALVGTTNNIAVDVAVTKTGTYVITTDTVNGYYFRATGTFTTVGSNTITLQGNGTPFAAGTNNFVVSYGGTVCDIQVTVLPAGTGAAVFTLVQTGGSCTPGTVTGTYILGQPLGATNSAVINVNVTALGTYTISTVFQGMTFISTGVFTSLGPQPVTLFGSGTPTTGGANVVPVTVGATTCSFTVNVQATAVGTLGGTPGACTPSTVNGTYFAGVPLVAATNTVQVQINVTTAGAYTISSNTVAGMTFTGSGTATAGAQNIILNGSGTPSTSGAQTFTVTFGSSSCTFIVNVQTGNAVGTLGGGPGACTPSTVNGTYTVGAALTAANTVQVQINVTTAGSYNITSNTVAGMTFALAGTAAVGTSNITLNGTGTPTASGAQTFTVTFGTSTCTFVVNVQAALSNDYFPRTTNSNWSYEFNDVSDDSLYRKVIANTHSALGNTYNIFMADDGTGLDSSGYYRKNGGDYFEYFDFGGYVGYDGESWGEYTMVKDNVAAGTNWKSGGFAGTISGNPINVRFSFTILQKDVPITILASTGSTTYQNVIIVEEKFEVEVAPGVWQDATSQVGYGKSYYARGIGLIKFEVHDTGGNVTDWQELRRYQVF